MSGLGARVAESFGSLARGLPEPRPAPAPARVPRLDDGALDVRRRPLGLRVRPGRHDRGRDHLGAAAAPAAIASPFLATLADRYPRERVMMGTDLIRAALMALAAVVIATDGPALVVYAVVDPDEPRRRRVPAGAGGAPPRPRARPRRAVGRERRREHARRRLDLRRAGDRRHHPRALERRRPSSGSTRSGSSPRPRCSSASGRLRPPPRHSTRPATAPASSPSCARACAPSRAIATCATVTGLYTAQTFIAGALNVLVVLVAFELIDVGRRRRRLPERRARDRRLRRWLRGARARDARPARRGLRDRRRAVRHPVRS